MTRRFITAMLLLACLLAARGSDLSACGDKSLAAGGIRMQRALAARYPASVLIYTPSASRLNGAARELDLQKTLRLVGHTYREVASETDLQVQVDSGHYNILLADIADALSAPPITCRYLSSTCVGEGTPSAFVMTSSSSVCASP